MKTSEKVLRLTLSLALSGVVLWLVFVLREIYFSHGPWIHWGLTLAGIGMVFLALRIASPALEASRLKPATARKVYRYVLAPLGLLLGVLIVGAGSYFAVVAYAWLRTAANGGEIAMAALFGVMAAMFVGYGLIGIRSTWGFWRSEASPEKRQVE
jgi:FtsH-binding integral membrane protein